MPACSGPAPGTSTAIAAASYSPCSGPSSARPLAVTAFIRQPSITSHPCLMLLPNSLIPAFTIDPYRPFLDRVGPCQPPVMVLVIGRHHPLALVVGHWRLGWLRRLTAPVRVVDRSYFLYLMNFICFNLNL